MSRKREPIPATVLTGFLGAGKTTLLNHLLSQKHGRKCAIIINEFGSVGIDHQLVVGVDEEILELSNGCLCCRVRGDLVKSLNSLFQKQKRFDCVLIETTGLADPSPVAHTFLATDLAGKVRLDAIVTVADAKHLEKELADAPEARAQIAFADVVLLNKADLVSAEDLERAEARIRSMNLLAKIHRTERSQVDAGKILGIRARELNAALSLTGLGARPAPVAHAHHDESVGSFAIVEDRPLDLKRVEKWLGEVINGQGERMYRSKGVLYIQGHPKRVVFQGVQMLFDSMDERFWNPGEARQSQLVFIGKGLDEAGIRAGFESCVASV